MFSVIVLHDFNTKKVRLKPAFERRLHGLQSHFNTKKVRLKLLLFQYRPGSEPIFQYQKGAIKTQPARQR